MPFLFTTLYVVSICYRPLPLLFFSVDMASLYQVPRDTLYTRSVFYYFSCRFFFISSNFQ